MCGQVTCLMSTRMFVEGHPPGLLLVFYRLWDKFQNGMSVGAIQSQWGALSWWWNAMIACLKDGLISQKVTKCWVTLGTVTIAFIQPVTGWIKHEVSQLNKANPYSERWLRLLQNISNTWGVTTEPLAPARVFRSGKLKIHKTYNGPVPLTYVDTGVYEGGGNDYYEVHKHEDLCWACRLDFVMKYHWIPCWEACNYKIQM